MMNRTLQKTCTYALMHFTVAIIVAYALTQNWRTALAVGLIEPLVQTFAFAVHERLWSKEGASNEIRPSCGHARLWSRRRTPITSATRL